MRILQLCNKAPYPANDGSSIAICTLAEGLADNGVELHLFPINTKKHFKPEENISPAFKEKTNYQSVYQDTNTSLPGAVKNLFSSESYFVSRFFFKEYEEQLIKKLKSYSFDIIQLEGVFMASYIPTIKQFSNAKIVLRSHNVEHQIWERHLQNEKSIIKKNYLTIQNNRLKDFEINAFNEADAIVTITDEDKKNISEICPGKSVYTCLTGVNLNSYNQVPSPKQLNTLFHFASMDWMPNIEAVDWLLDSVWTEVIKQKPDAQLVLAGRGMPQRIKKLASKNMTIIDDVKDSSEFYHNYDIMLVPLWSGSGLRIKLVEGLAYGKAIITTSIGAEGIPYTKNKDFLIADSSQDFTKAILTLLSDDQQKQNLQRSARTLAETSFDYKRIAANLISFYKDLIK
ncbi:MAG: glycosyltransferase [Bacteroidetes bacterium]|jgi:glycosyltransferase involved in cell wall biosynthesis|nr:glycosyltransferase [Bacteroidota bacterium]MDF2453245.1 glycosyltransferase [Bacteroidota bacterium]